MENENYYFSMITLYFLFIIIFLLIFFNKITTKKQTLKSVPVVDNNLLFSGHAINFKKDIISFITDSYFRFGSIFQIQIYNKKFVILCDKNYCQEYYNLSEDKMSLYDVLERLFFKDAFCDQNYFFEQMVKFVKKKIVLFRNHNIISIINQQIFKFVDFSKKEFENKINLNDHIINCVARINMKCFVGIEMNQDFFDLLINFIKTLNKAMFLTDYQPKFILKLTIKKTLKKYRRLLTSKLSPEIESYRLDKSKNNSIIIREAINYIDEYTKKPFSNEQIGDIIIFMLHVSTENTSLAISSVLTDLTLYSYWDTLQKELFDLKLEEINNQKLLENCLMESARINTHIFVSNRKPKSNIVLGDHLIGKVDSVVICAPMLMHYGEANKYFKEPEIYNPNRFYDVKNKWQNILTWDSLLVYLKFIFLDKIIHYLQLFIIYSQNNNPFFLYFSIH